MQINKMLVLLISLVSLNSFGRNQIREVYTNDRSIQTIYLALGRSTVLKFREKPTNVIIGNKNYYNVEYINNDLTIQPLGAVNTNLFVYTENKRTYALILKIVPVNEYDDIVHVRWKSNFKQRRPPKKSAKRKLVKLKPTTLVFEKRIEVRLNGLSTLPREKGYFLDFTIRNISNKGIRSKDVEIFLTRRNKKLTNQNLIYQKEMLNKDEFSKARIFLLLEEKAGFSVNIKLNSKTKKSIVWRRYL